MSSVLVNAVAYLSERLHCRLCEHRLSDPVQLRYNHRYSCACFNGMETERIHCPVCRARPSTVHVNEKYLTPASRIDECLKQQVEKLKVKCQKCRSSECTKTKPPDPLQQAQTGVPLTNAGHSSNLLDCPLQSYGCCQKFTASQKHQHNMSDEHGRIVAHFVLSLQEKCDTVRINRIVEPCGATESIAEDSILAIYFNLIENITETIGRTVQELPPNPVNATRVQSDSPASLLQQMDQGRSNPIGSLSSLIRLNGEAMEDIPNPTASSVEGRQALGSSATQSIIDSCNPFAFISDSDPSSEIIARTDGLLVWCISEARGKISDAVARRKGYINSPIFSTPSGDQKVFVRLYLNGEEHLKFLTIHLGVHTPMRTGFHGGVKFIIVDQSETQTLDHITGTSSGSLNEIGDRLRCDEFADKTRLHVDPSPYIRKDQIILIVQLRSVDQEHYANLPISVSHALTRIGI